MFSHTEDKVSLPVQSNQPEKAIEPENAIEL